MFSLDQAILLFGTFYFYGGVVLLFLPIIMKVLPETKVHIFRYFASQHKKTNKQIFRSLTIFQKTSRSSRKSVVNESNHFNFPGSLPHWDSPDIHSRAVSWRSHWSGFWFKHLTRLRDNSNQTDWCLDCRLPKLKLDRLFLWCSYKRTLINFFGNKLANPRLCFDF